MKTTATTRPGPLSVSVTNDAKVGRAICHYRRERNLSLEAVAARAGISASFKSRLENGQRELTLATMEALAQAVGLSMAELVALSNRPLAGEGGSLPDTMVHLQAQASVGRVGHHLLWIGQRWPASADAAMEAGCMLHAGLAAMLEPAGQSGLLDHGELARAALAARQNALAGTPEQPTAEGRNLAEVLDLLDRTLAILKTGPAAGSR